jgi:hypothetical protein
MLRRTVLPASVSAAAAAVQNPLSILEYSTGRKVKQIVNSDRPDLT